MMATVQPPRKGGGGTKKTGPSRKKNLIKAYFYHD